MRDNCLDFGYTEMYEWAEVPLEKYGLFVEFDREETEKIVPYHLSYHDPIGVSSASSHTESDNPDEWYMSYVMDEVGALKLEKEKLAVGVKQYDQQKEMSFIKTMPWEHFIRIPSEIFDADKKYIKRSNRNEWAKVNLIGKCIIYDDGKCEPGTYCSPYTGPEKILWGHAIPAEPNKPQYYVLSRFSDNTIIILFK